MSADNGIFIFNTEDGRICVVHATLSGMPQNIPDIVKNMRTCYGDKPEFFDKKDAQKADAHARKLARNEPILEYGIVDWTETDYDELMRPYRVCSNENVLFGSSADLAEMFTSFHADDAEGVFAIGIDGTDPTFEGGIAMVFDGDDGMFTEWKRFSPAIIPSMLEAMEHALKSLENICVKSGKSLVLRSKDVEPLPKNAPRGVEFRHRGLLAANDTCMVLVGDKQENPQFSIMVPSDNGRGWERIYSGSIFWMDSVANVISKAAVANPLKPGR
jgi:hypothetical protein